jgi:phosphoribosylanthranilate isomerase
MWIKICANTNLDDAQMAAELGADAVGFVFAPSTRRVTAAEVARITPHLPESIERVGVFPALAAEEIAQAAEEAGLSTVQLHGGVNLSLLRQLHDIFDERVKLIQTVHWNVGAEGGNATAMAQDLQRVAAEGLADRVLIDSSAGSARGGTGVSFDWNGARSTLAEFTASFKLIVAGGLRQDNVAEAIRYLRPWGVDVASGVEEVPGRKSHERLDAFIRAVRNANTSTR